MPLSERFYYSGVIGMSGMLTGSRGTTRTLRTSFQERLWLCYAILGSISMVEPDFHPAVWDRALAIAVAGSGRGAL